MFDKWSRYKAGQAALGDTADFCRGGLEQAASEQAALQPGNRPQDRRQAAADHYRIDRPLLDELGTLADKKGGPHARKYKGYGTPYTESERVWLEAALKKLIRRAAEVAHDTDANRALITMNDLPPL